MLKVAVIGAGYWGPNLIRVFEELGVLGFICDKDKERLGTQALRFPHIKNTDSIKTVLKDKEITAVVLATPAATHYALAKEALLCQKHVFVEKPLSLKIREAQGLITLARRQNRILMVGHILHYHPAVIKLKGLIDEGALGRIEYIYSHRLNMGRFRAEENVLWSFAPHDISCILMLLGRLPGTVRSFGGRYLQKNVYDITLTTLDFPKGVRSHIFVSWLHPFKEQKLVVVGDKKMVVFDDISEEKLFFYPHAVKWNHNIPVALKADREVIPVERSEPLKLECQHFIDCINKNVSPETDGDEGKRVLKVLSAATRSLLLNGKRVLINEN